MNIRGKQSISSRLSLAITGVAAAVVVVTIGATAVYDFRDFRLKLIRELAVQAQMIGAASEPVLTLSDMLDADEGASSIIADFDAAEALDPLRVNPHIICSAIYSSQGDVLAQYVREGSLVEFGAPPAVEQSGFVDDYAEYYHPVEDADGERIGTVYIRSDLTEASDHFGDTTKIAGLVLVLAIVMAYLISVPVGRIIARPILDLVLTTRKVTASEDYTLRAEVRSEDEVGLLVQNFNAMLERVQESNDKLGDYNRELERKVAERTAELVVARDEALEASRTKGEFLANMSHEIRTPMNAIIGLSELVLRTELSPRARDYLNKVRLSSRTLLGIINDVLDFSKIEAGKLDLDEVGFDLREVLEDIADLMGEAAAHKNLEFLIHIDEDVPAALIGASLRLNQVLTNLANNAIKFTERGQVVIRAELVDGDGERARVSFSVADTGMGIEPAALEKIFDSFTQSDSSMTRRFGGTGLGLAICKRLVDLMGGDIRVESEVGVGSTFAFELDLRRQPETQEIRLSAPESSHGMKVLVVDDNAVSCDILVGMLRSFSLEADAVSSGADALVRLIDALEDRAYDLVLMDWMMPEMDGIEVARRIEAEERLVQHVPKIIMVTAHGREAVMRQAEDAGLDGFLVKPVSQSLLFNTVMEVLGEEEARVQLVKGRGDTRTRDRDALASARILVVEDIPLNQDIARVLLEDAGIVVSVANNGREAVEAVSAARFDAVLMDIQMPVMDGYEATRAIRSDGRFDDLPIIAMTAHAMKGDRERCLEAGMNDHVTKPIEIDALMASLATWVELPEVSRPTPPPPAPVVMSDAVPDFGVDIPGIQVETLLARVAGSKAALSAILIGFAKDFADTDDQILQAWERGEREEAQRLSHSMKGVTGNIAAETLYQRITMLHESIVAGDEQAFTAKFAAFRVAHREVVDGCLRLSSGAGEEQAQSDTFGVIVDPKSEQAYLEELAILLVRNKLKARRVFQDHQERWRTVCPGEAVDQLGEAIRWLDFRGARAKLKTIAVAMGIQLDTDREASWSSRVKSGRTPPKV